MKDREQERPARTAITVLALLLRLLTVILAVILIAGLGRAAYLFGYRVFREAPVEESPGRDIEVVISEDSSVSAVARTLEVKGLIEDRRVFIVQVYLSSMKDRLRAGTYTLNTSWTPAQIIDVLAGQEEREASDG